MAECLSRAKWCKGPGGFGSKCRACEKAEAGTGSQSKSAPPGRPQPVVREPVRPVAPARVTPVARVQVTPVVQPVLVAPTAVTQTFYRAVKSGPKVYLGRNGFQPRVDIGLVQIRRMMRNLFDRTTLSVDIPSRAVILHEAYKSRLDWTPLDMVREIKKEKSDSTPQISTDLEPACGGYAPGNYVFRIEYTGLYLNKAINNNENDWSPTVKPKLVSNQTMIDTSDLLAIACGGKEVAFLTGIPLANIRAYHRPNETEWRPLWGPDGASLWATAE